MSKAFNIRDTLADASPVRDTAVQPVKRRLLLLVIDADRDHAAGVRKMLRKTNLHVVHAPNLPAGIEALDQQRIDVVLLDLMLPGASPLESLVQLTNWHARVPIILVTDLDDGELVNVACSHGAADYIPKRDLRYSILMRSLRFVFEHQKRRRLEERVEIVQQQERQRVARDLHDGVIQTISAMRLQIQILAKDRRLRGGEGAPELDQLACDAQLAIDEVRQFSRGLYSQDFHRERLLAAVHDCAEEFTSHFGVQVEVLGDDCQLEYVIKSHLYRICQECLRNIARHAQATRVWITLRENAGRIKLEIRDNGIGFDLNRGTPETGMGLASIRERAGLLSGQAVIASRPGRGTRVCVDVPVRVQLAADFPDYDLVDLLG